MARALARTAVAFASLLFLTSLAGPAVAHDIGGSAPVAPPPDERHLLPFAIVGFLVLLFFAGRPSNRRNSSTRVAVVGLATLLAATMIPSAIAQEADPSVVGRWSKPFEEDGKKERCRLVKGDVICKPTAVSIVVLSDGRILYWNGIEGTESVEITSAPEYGALRSRNSKARVLDLRRRIPGFGVPRPETAGGENPAIHEERDDLEEVLGTLGVPGRPGDGPVGSTVGQVAQGPPSAPPDDPRKNDADMFCSDVKQLFDGRLLIAGGTDFYSQPSVPDDVPMVGGWGRPELEGIRNAWVFDPATNRFTQAEPMKYGRWYPSLVTLADGKVLVASGVTRLVANTQGGQVRRTETYNPATGRWQENYTGMASENSLPLYPRLHLMPNGKIFYTGAGQMNGLTPTGWDVNEALWALQQFFNLETREWEIVGPSQFGVRNGAFSVMLPLTPPYKEATLLQGGGTLGPTPSGYVATPLSELISVDSDGNVSSEMTGMLNNPRWFSTPVLLPDGTVAAFNGANGDEVLFPGPQIAVRETELYDPATGEWSSLAPSGRDRTYHNSAVLLPDARVLVGGHSPIPAFVHKHMDPGGPFANNDKDPSFEIFEPPYLFRGARPEIRWVKSGIDWGETFSVTIGGPYKGSDVASVVLSRVPAQTHTIDADQRALELAFSGTGKTISVKAPPDGIAAPPGPYYLFVNRDSPDGPIPSMARILTVGKGNPGPAPAPLRDSMATARRGAASAPDDTSPTADLPPPAWIPDEESAGGIGSP